jgi:hypothetical protein
MMSLRKFVDALAEELGVEPEARKKWWQRRGVPLRWRRQIIALASDRGVEVDWDDLEDRAALECPVKVQNVPANARGDAATAEAA